MAHYAFLNMQNIVTEVIVGKDETEGVINWEIHYGNIREQVCKRTSKNTKGGIHYTNGEPSADQTKAFRKNYAAIGYIYDENRDAFYSQQPYESWTLNETSCLWEAPIAYPTDGERYDWNEEQQQWDLIT